MTITENIEILPETSFSTKFESEISDDVYAAVDIISIPMLAHDGARKHKPPCVDFETELHCEPAPRYKMIHGSSMRNHTMDENRVLVVDTLLTLATKNAKLIVARPKAHKYIKVTRNVAGSTLLICDMTAMTVKTGKNRTSPILNHENRQCELESPIIFMVIVSFRSFSMTISETSAMTNATDAKNKIRNGKKNGNRIAQID
mmetsp:Transcript_844/g.2814  ORF Transcript_844/g.2814 Transcript_844/m.2814 type:complete len:202 (+) Transcript_844:4269-4874(+)